MSEKVVAYKGFNKDLTCTPDGKVFQYEIGQTYKMDGPVKVCRNGFHACEHPLNVFGHYAPATSRFAVVEMGGDISRDGSDTKIASAEITIKAELKLPELISRAIDYVFSRVTYEEGSQATGDYGAASATGDYGAASATGYQGAASATGTRGAASATGYQGAAMSSGFEGRVMGKEGNALFLVERHELNGPVINVWAGIAGRDGIKADTWYTLKDGQPVEC